MVRLHFDIEGADELARNTSQAADRVQPLMKRILRSVGRRGVTLLRNFAPTKTGKLARSIHLSITGRGRGGLRVHWFDRVPYGGFVVSGTRPHTIFARNAKALVFTVGGQLRFAKSVNHPGTKPNKYPARAARQIQRDGREIINTGMREIARIITRG